MSICFLDEVSEFKELLQAFNRRESHVRISGLAAPAKPFFFSFLSQRLKQSIVLILPEKQSLSRFEEQCQFFFSQFSSSQVVRQLPPLNENPYQKILPSLEAVSMRMKFFYGLLHNPPSLVVTNLSGLLMPFPDPFRLGQMFLRLEKGGYYERDRLLRLLDEYGYAREDLIASRGEYAWRGGIVDVFSPWENLPFRIEYTGDEIASIREFDLSTQRSIRKLERVLLPSLREFTGSQPFSFESGSEKDMRQKMPSVPFTHYLGDSLFIVDHMDEVEREWESTLNEYREQSDELKKKGESFWRPEDVFSLPIWEQLKNQAVVCQEWDSFPSRKVVHFPFQSVPRFNNKIPFFIEYMKKLQEERDRCLIYFSSAVIRQKLAVLLSEHQILAAESSTPHISPKEGEMVLLVGGLDSGFSFPREKITFFSERDIFTEEKVIVSRPSVKHFLSHFQDLRAGDYVVHTDYGIGIFKGLIKMKVDGKGREFIELLYRDDDKLFVPVESLNLVQKYSPVRGTVPSLDKLGSLTWQKTKGKTKKAVEDIAKELLHLYAQRKAIKGFRFSPEGNWQVEFDKTFEYEETEDQSRTIKEIKQDMESEFPMDRLLCGDVGYGKTEVAMRAAFKAVMDGKQVVVLCPTTVLASQHLKTFENRLTLFPVRVEALTRLQSKKKQHRIIEGLKKGMVDTLIGTHRLLSKDVEFHDLGLLIIDEEQRFGVKDKEKIKQMKANIDVLTLTATPIPRTLNLSLTGLRDISLIETPPKDRLAIHTVVTTFNPRLIASAIKQELNREGQVYYIFNRIEDMEGMASKIEKWVPEAKVVTIHGQMPALALEKRMIDFINKKYTVLVSTTIIENGIDIPLVNTLIVDRADQFGLAQLYQLRGRVGRSSRQAFAYFLVPLFAELSSQASQRLEALKEFSELGSGFRLAAKDLEIRGGGNLFGARQHGCLEAVGFDYFIQLLEQTIRELKGEQVEEVKSEINLKMDIQIPEDYLPQVNLRLSLYKRISSAVNFTEIKAIEEEMNDRFGPLPRSVRNLLRYGVIKLLAQKLKVKALDRVENRIIFKFFPATSVHLTRMTRLLKTHGGTITPQGVLTLRVSMTSEEAFLDETIDILKELYGCTIMT
ncbi:MAG: transcription-repair coupling factor [Candidatus Aminicenantales bacterium]